MSLVGEDESWQFVVDTCYIARFFQIRSQETHIQVSDTSQVMLVADVLISGSTRAKYIFVRRHVQRESTWPEVILDNPTWPFQHNFFGQNWEQNQRDDKLWV